MGRLAPPRRVGWIIGDQLERSHFCRAGYLTSGGVGLARYAWLAAHVNARPELGLRHAIYRPWGRYDALVFLKAMGARALALLERARARGWLTIFDANVNYYEPAGREYYRGMLPTAVQREAAIAITRAADAVIADSEFLAARCRPYNPRVAWIPDSVNLEQVPPYRPWRPTDARLRLLWAGEAVKLFELLVVEDVLRRYARHLELWLVTNDLAALDRWHEGYRARFEALLGAVPHRILRYAGVPALFALYGEGGVAIAPRFLDNSYNLGHTEWKITLAMACGRLVLCSPVPSYATVAARAGHRGIRICPTAGAWEDALDALLAGAVDWPAEEAAARDVVARHYATAVVARQHADFLRGLFDAPGLSPQAVEAPGPGLAGERS